MCFITAPFYLSAEQVQPSSFLMPIQGPELSSSEDTGAHNARPVEWKSTADSAPNHKTASLSKESIVPQRSRAVHDQPTLDDAHDKGGFT